MISIIFSVLLLTTNINGKIYFKEEFTDDSWHENWIPSEHSGKEWGRFVHSAGKYYGDPAINKGIQTSEDARFYGLSIKFEPFSNKNKVLVLQYSVKHEQNLDCGGGYIKLFDCSLDPKRLHDKMPYLIMFGPDICGSERKVHLIFNYKGQNLQAKRNISLKDDEFSHLYTLIVKPDNTYIVKIDNQIVEEGELENNWDFLLPRTVKDPNVKKPEDWVDDPKMEDPEDEKPEDWDKPEFISDKNSVKPVDWDDDIDGDWEPAKIKNPNYKGEWKPVLVANPKYKGPWNHPVINNPDYEPDPSLYKYDEICGVGFELWQVSSGSIFDNILITDDENEAFAHGEATWGAIREKEKDMKRRLDGEKDGEDPFDDDESFQEDEIDHDDYESSELDPVRDGFKAVDENEAADIKEHSSHDEF